ncbi:MAG: prepilin-type N-terminal cleavage/methylation domain-containing protein [Gemmatimonadaceae bacterium]
MSNPSPRTARVRAGFSLIEVVVAMTLLTVVIGALSVLAAKTSERARRADILAKRNFVMVQQINRYASAGFDTLRWRLNNSPASHDTIWGDTIGGAVKYFLRRDTVTYYPTNADTFMVEAKVVIVPRTLFLKDTIYKDSVMVHRRNPNTVNRLNY